MTDAIPSFNVYFQDLQSLMTSLKGDPKCDIVIQKLSDSVYELLIDSKVYQIRAYSRPALRKALKLNFPESKIGR